MQYWINHNGVQSGPVDLEDLKEMGLTSAAYVWHEGMPDWVKITQLPELQGLYDIPVGTPVEPQPVENISTAHRDAARVLVKHYLQAASRAHHAHVLQVFDLGFDFGGFVQRQRGQPCAAPPVRHHIHTDDVLAHGSHCDSLVA